MKTVIVAVAMSLAVACSAQTAKVVALTPDEAREAKAISDQQKELDNRLAALRHKIIASHLYADGEEYWSCSIGLPIEHHIKEGWGCGSDFEFSDDYRFIVPSRNTGTSATGWAYPIIATAPASTPIVFPN